MAPRIARDISANAEELIDLTPQMRDELLEFHPIRERNYRLHTPMLERTYAVVRERVWMRRPGVYFYGSPRLGKTTCAEEIENLLQVEFPRILVVRINARRTTRPSEAHMFRLILEGTRHALSGRTSPDLLFHNVISDVQVSLAARGGTHFVLMIDEMHALGELDLHQLLAVNNSLKSEGIAMTTISFAQPEIKERVTGLMIRHQNQVIARFLSEPLAFVGCSSSDELKVLLEAYDDYSEFPDKSGWSYTRFFLPSAYRSGFRLAKYSRRVWRALMSASGSSAGAGLPMEHVCLTIEYLLSAMRHEDCDSFVLSDADITEAVEQSNLANFNGLMSEPGCE